jgi:hypothetical protein
VAERRDVEEDRMSRQPARGDNRHPDGDLAPGADSERLAAVLRAAAAPAHPDELAGEEAAMAAFRTAADTAPGRPSLVRTVLAKVLTVKAVIVLAVAGSAGVVVAATGGVLPTPWSAGPPTEQSGTATPGSADRTTEPRRPGSSAPETPSITELCERYASHEHPEKALNDPAFRPLVAAAGKKDKVPDYCAAHASQSPKPGDKGKPGDSGNGRPDEPGEPGKTGEPEDKPGDKPGKEPTQPGGNGRPAQTHEPEKPGDNGQGTNPRRSPEPSVHPPHPGGAAPDSGAGPPSHGG